MQVSQVILVILLFAVKVQYVCLDDTLIQTSHRMYDLEPATILPQHCEKNPCETHTIACNFSGSKLIWFSTFISFCLLFFPLIRIQCLQPGPSEDNTLFWWSLCLGCGSSAIWGCYFSHCSYWEDTISPVLFASLFGTVLQFALSIAAIWKTPAPRDYRCIAILVCPSLCYGIAYGLKSRQIQYTGWFGLCLTGLSHVFRFSSLVYRDNFDIKLFIASVVGSVGGFLWLGHPQLCLSREYKITSYIVAVIRGTEAIMMCSYAIARQLRRIEGYPVQPARASSVVPGVAAEENDAGENVNGDIEMMGER